jgi:hypothetical protein
MRKKEGKMKRFKNHLITAAVLSVLVIIGTIMNSRPSVLQAASGPTVTIDPTQLPLPVQGSTSVSGTVAATQNGTWNVGISGTPNVNVTNPATAPVLFLNVNDPGRIPYQSTMLVTNCPAGECIATFSAVPSGHRLVIQHISGVETGTSALPTQPVLLLNQIFPLSGFLASSTSNSGTNAYFDQSVLFYFDTQQAPVVITGFGLGVQVTVTLTGYMLDCTIAPCAAVAH